MTLVRTRWAAIGAGVAVTLGAGGIGLVSATTPDDAAAFVPVTPCRVIDTRPDFQVGPKSSPLGPGETETVLAVGSSGDCDSVPSSATGVALNVTTTDASLLTFLTIWEADQPRPDASSLNPSPGQPPTPNAVTTGLNGDGEFSIYNFQGSVHVIADVVGFYTDHHHDDRYYTKSQSDSRYYTTSQADEQFLTEEQLDARLPTSDSVTLAGGGFTSRDAPLAWRPGTSCFRPGTPSNGMRHTIPVTAGSTVTSLGIRAYGDGTDVASTVTLYAQRPGSSDGVIVEAWPLVATGLLETTLDLPDELMDTGEALYVHFTSGSSDAYLCAATVFFDRPG